jgi:glycosyltransferase involved in cell wall biosynthesis
VIRVGFVLTFDATTWLGGISYFRNLLGALAAHAQSTIAPVILAGERTDAGVLAQFPKFETIRSDMFDAGTPAWNWRRLSSRLLGRDLSLERLLRRHDIAALSHHGFLGSTGSIPILGWIPDFQELHLPEFFSDAELRGRARMRSLFGRKCRGLILSSQAAWNDLHRLQPAWSERGRVLQFVADARPVPVEECLSVLAKHRIAAPYLYLPNQFWAHKNHGVVVEALQLLKARGERAIVVATGNAHDHRQPGQHGKLIERVKAADVGDRFLMLGALPYREVVALMSGAAAVINPSRFEGWSTTVEEAKTLGKAILLSDLDVHREQAPLRGRYFRPDDAVTLAELMMHALQAFDPSAEAVHMAQAQAQLVARQRDFALAYTRIVQEFVAS